MLRFLKNVSSKVPRAIKNIKEIKEKSGEFFKPWVGHCSMSGKLE